MANSMLAALRNAMHAGPADDAPESGEMDVPMGGRPDTQTEETSMSVNQGTSAARNSGGHYRPSDRPKRRRMPSRPLTPKARRAAQWPSGKRSPQFSVLKASKATASACLLRST